MSEFSEVVVETESADSWKSKGNDFYKNKSYKEAIDAYSKAIALDPTNALLYTNRAAASLMVLQYKEAIQDSDLAISLDPNCAKAFFRKATALKGLGNIDGAVDALSAGLVLDPANSVALQDRSLLQNAKTKLTQARDLLARRLYTQALTILDQLTKDVGGANREINIMKVKALLALKRNEEALNLTNSLMRSAQNGDSELLAMRAQCLFSMGEIESSFKHLQQAVRGDPDNTALRTQYRLVRDIEEKKNAGDEYFKQGNFIEAINSWSQCITITKDSPTFQAKLFLNRATALSKQKKYDEAIKDCSKAVYYNPSYVKAYIRRAESYLSLGGPQNIQKAIEDFETAIELESDEDLQETYKDKLKKAKVALKRSKRKDLYALLGVGPQATEAEIKSAYKKAALKFHPDKQASKTEEEKKEAENMFKTIGEAYEVLSNPEKKARYDSGVELEDLDNPHAGEGGYGGHGHSHGGIDPNILFQMFMQQQGGRF